MTAVAVPVMSRSPFAGSPAEVDATVSSYTPAGIIVLPPPVLSAACIAARSVQAPSWVETQLVAAGLPSAASVVLSTVNDAALAPLASASAPSVAPAWTLSRRARRERERDWRRCKRGPWQLG